MINIGSGIVFSYGGSDSKESNFNAGDQGSIPESGRCLGERNGYPRHHSCLNSMDSPSRLQVMQLQRVRHN